MFKTSIVGLAIFLVSGCAHDNYHPTPGVSGQLADQKTALHDCKREVIHQYYANRSDAPAILGGLAPGGILVGAIAGAAAGTLAANSDPNQMQIKDVNPAIEACMARAGYTGTSEN